LLLGGALNAAPQASDRVPEIGEPHALPRSSFQMMVASAQTWPYETIEVSGVTYGIAINTNTLKIAYVDTRDPKFKTLGLTVGSTLQEVLATGAEKPWAEPGWAYHTKLRSGWSAAFVEGTSMTNLPLQPTSKIAFFFKRE